MSILEKLMFDELLEAVAPFLNAAQEALPQVPNPLPSREAPPLVPDQNPFPVEDISPETKLQVFFAAPPTVQGSVVIDIGLLEI